jgi:glycosyltransferase involved in cell wall biosynthesis
MTQALAFLIPTKNRHHAVARTVQRVQQAMRRTPPGSCSLLLCDQSPSPYPASEGMTVLHRPDLSGLPAARNALLKASRADVVCFLDDDTDLGGDFALQLLALARQEPEVVAWGPVIEARGRWTRRLHRLAQLGAFHDPRRQVAGIANRRTTALFGCCFAVRRRIALAIGFDARRPGYALGEDLDFFVRLLRATRGTAAIRFATCLRAHHRRDGADREAAYGRGLAKAGFLVYQARCHGAGNPATLIHAMLAAGAALSGFGAEPASWRGVLRGLWRTDAHGTARQ